MTDAGGGDSDTIAAMAGALAGTLHGANWIPEQWYSDVNSKCGENTWLGLRPLALQSIMLLPACCAICASSGEK